MDALGSRGEAVSEGINICTIESGGGGANRHEFLCFFVAWMMCLRQKR
jgi:hypothetical protein